ncbi:hypothetical protein BH09VER1_BH09VER1_36600 [soil metagenome]
MANRHGLIAGATGTGKTVTLRVLADIKDDLAGLCQPGAAILYRPLSPCG